MDHPQPDEGGAPAPRTAARLAFVVFIGVALFFFWTEHRAHLYGALPYVLLLACPVMHLFHHKGHDR